MITDANDLIHGGNQETQHGVPEADHAERDLRHKPLTRIDTRARNSALTIALSYVAGGLVPLAPYFLLRSVQAALIGSVIITLIALFVFGFIKGRFTTNRPVRSAWQTVLVGSVAAAAAFTIARMIG